MSTDLSVSERKSQSSPSASTLEGDRGQTRSPTAGSGTRAIAAKAEGYDAQMALLRPVQAKRDPAGGTSGASGGGALAAGPKGGPGAEAAAETKAGTLDGAPGAAAADAPKTATVGRTLDDLALKLTPIDGGLTAQVREQSQGLQAKLNGSTAARFLLDDALGALFGNGLTFIDTGNEARLISIERFQALLKNPQFASRFQDVPSADAPLARWNSFTETKLTSQAGKLARLKTMLKVADRSMAVLGVVGGTLNLVNGVDAWNGGSSFSDKANAVTTMVQGAGGITAALMGLAGVAGAPAVGLGVAALQLRSRGAQLMKAWKGVEAFGLGEWVAEGGGVPGAIAGAVTTAAALVLETVVGAFATIYDIMDLLWTGGELTIDLLKDIFGEDKGDEGPSDPWISPPETNAPPKEKEARPRGDALPRADMPHDKERKLPQTGRH